MHSNLMNDVKVKKHELLDVLLTNLEAHEAEVAGALSARHVEMLEYFQNVADKLSRDPEYQPREHISFPVPKNNGEDYKRAIRMVEMTVDEVIELSESQFDKLVMDNWHWKQDLLNTTAFYGKAEQ